MCVCVRAWERERERERERESMNVGACARVMCICGPTKALPRLCEGSIKAVLRPELVAYFRLLT